MNLKKLREERAGVLEDRRLNREKGVHMDSAFEEECNAKLRNLNAYIFEGKPINAPKKRRTVKKDPLK